MADRKTYTAEDFKGCNGRRVLAEGVIEDTYPTSPHGVFVTFAPPPGATRDDSHRALVQPSAIVEILPEEIKVGDRVTSPTWSRPARVEAISRDRAWVYWTPLDDGDVEENDVHLLSDLTLVEQAG